MGAQERRPLQPHCRAEEPGQLRPRVLPQFRLRRRRHALCSTARCGQPPAPGLLRRNCSRRLKRAARLMSIRRSSILAPPTARSQMFPYDPQRFVAGNYIDAMALVSKEAWAMVGGYDHVRYGWEDYDFWSRMAGNRPRRRVARHRARRISCPSSIDDEERRRSSRKLS